MPSWDPLLRRHKIQPQDFGAKCFFIYSPIKYCCNTCISMTICPTTTIKIVISFLLIIKEQNIWTAKFKNLDCGQRIGLATSKKINKESRQFCDLQCSLKKHISVTIRTCNFDVWKTYDISMQKCNSYCTKISLFMWI